MPSQDEVEEALRKLGGEGTTLEVTNQLQKDGKLSEYKNKNVTRSVVGRVLARLHNWETVKKEYRSVGYTGIPMTGYITWVLAEGE